MSLTPPELRQFVADLASDPERWQRHIKHASEERVYEQIWDDEEVNAWVICWSEDQDTGFHDHDDSAAAILIVDGQVREERLRLGAAADSREYGPGSTLFVPPSAIHRVLHAEGRPAVTLHAYSPPLRSSGAYRITRDGRLERVVQALEEELRAQPVLS